MTNEKWLEIVAAWAAYVLDSNASPSIQYQRVVDNSVRWVDWVSKTRLAKNDSPFCKWRIKPQPIRSRQIYRTDSLTCTNTMIWKPGQEEPTPPPQYAWLGEWLEVPESPK